MTLIHHCFTCYTRTRQVDEEYYAALVVGDRVWSDLNANGLQDAGEAGIENVVVSLYEVATGTLIGTRASDSTGKYQCKYYLFLFF